MGHHFQAKIALLCNEWKSAMILKWGVKISTLLVGNIYTRINHHTLIVFLKLAMSFWHSGICIVQIGTFSTGALITYSITPTILKTIREEIRACGNYHLLCHSKIMTGSGSSENN